MASMYRRDCIQFRTLKPPGGGYVSQHSKTWVIDHSVYVGGSANFTGNSERNFEEAVMSRVPEVVGDGAKNVEDAWQNGTEVSIDTLLTLRSKSRSRSGAT